VHEGYAPRVRGSSRFWWPGTQILWQYKAPRDLPWIDPMTVVRDDDRGLVAWLAAGTETLQARRPDGRDLRADSSQLFNGRQVGVRVPWKHNDVLRISPIGAPWSVWLLWDCRTGEFRGWYGNLEAPLTREGNMVMTRDHTLDVLIRPDGRHARKDEDELQAALSAGWYDRHEVDVILQAADELEAIIDAWDSPFCDGWENFTPDPSWPIPTLPAHYRDRPRIDT
jgi:hypothetical protein